MKKRFLSDEQLQELAAIHGTPLYIYSWPIVRGQLESLTSFDVVRYAQKANAKLALLELLHGEGALVDAVSLGELRRALAAGWLEEEIVFTADIFTREVLEFIGGTQMRVNAGSPDMIAQLAEVRPGSRLTLRVNPGFGAGHAVKVNTGGIWSKHGIWHEELPAVAAEARKLGLEVDGLHIHIGSGADMESHERAANKMLELSRMIGPGLAKISAGGGLPVAYRETDPEFDLQRYCSTWSRVKEELSTDHGHEVTLETEPGRYLVAEAGLLLTEVRATKRMGDVRYLLVDAGFHTLARPAMYGAYHHLSVVGMDDEPRAPRVVAGPLCESADVFTQDMAHRPTPQELPAAGPGDLLCIHDTGAYGASMASNYNSQLLPAEVLVTDDGTPRLIRRRQTLDELLQFENS